jgi:hypothetical protein
VDSLEPDEGDAVIEDFFRSSDEWPAFPPILTPFAFLVAEDAAFLYDAFLVRSERFAEVAVGPAFEGLDPLLMAFASLGRSGCRLLAEVPRLAREERRWVSEIGNA